MKVQMIKKENWNKIIQNAKSIGGIILTALIIKATIVEAYQIPTGSMEDTILVGDFILGNKFIFGIRIPGTDWRLPPFKHPKQGDIIIFKYPRDPSQNYIKRAIAVGGQTVTIRNKKVYVDNKFVELPDNGKYSDPNIRSKRMQEGLIYPKGAGNRDNYGPIEIPEGYIFVMGDNRDESYDSRYWGLVHERNVLGEGLIIYWSWDKTIPLYNIFEKVRWSRIGTILS